MRIHPRAFDNYTRDENSARILTAPLVDADTEAASIIIMYKCIIKVFYTWMLRESRREATEACDLASPHANIAFVVRQTQARLRCADPLVGRRRRACLPGGIG